MANRIIHLFPKYSYNFKSNLHFASKWDFLPDSERVKVIAQQLTYLNFHEWLIENLKHTDKKKPLTSDLNPIAFHVEEGFYRTDILLYASICEASIYVAIEEEYKSNRRACYKKVLDCFEQTEKKAVQLSHTKFSISSIIGVKS